MPPSVSPRPRNLAGVRGPLRSPFRYPGGKNWLTPVVVEWLSGVDRPFTFVEPFAGGASVSLAVAAENLADEIRLVERDPAVAAVWSVIFSGGADELARRIEEFKFSEEKVRWRLNARTTTEMTRALRTIVWNRVSHGGRMTKRSGILNAGEKGRGLGSRWYPETLARRIRDIDDFEPRIVFREGDGMDEIAMFVDDPQAVLFIDPPYTAGDELSRRAGERLYNHSALDHEKLFAFAGQAVGRVLMTYDDDPAVRRMASDYGLDIVEITMRTTHHAQRVELLITNDRDALDAAAETVERK